MCDEIEAEYRQEEHPEVGGDVGAVGEQQEHVTTRGHDHRQEPEPELATAPPPAGG